MWRTSLHSIVSMNRPYVHPDWLVRLTLSHVIDPNLRTICYSPSLQDWCCVLHMICSVNMYIYRCLFELPRTKFWNVSEFCLLQFVIGWSVKIRCCDWSVLSKSSFMGTYLSKSSKFGVFSFLRVDIDITCKYIYRAFWLRVPCMYASGVIGTVTID